LRTNDHFARSSERHIGRVGGKRAIGEIRGVGNAADALVPVACPHPNSANNRGGRMSRIAIEHDGPLAVLTIDSPPLNLFGGELMDELAEAVQRLAADPPRGLLIRADGRVVSGGVDVHVFDGLSPEQAAGMWVRLLDLVHTVERLPLPTVFAAHSLCLTAAFELALGCDLLLAAESARFGLVETVVGLTPAMGGTQRLLERAGPARARELVMTGELYAASTLERWNVVNRVLPDDGFDVAARDFAHRLAEGPTSAHAATKAIVRAALDEGGAHGADRRVPELAGDLFATQDLQSAVRSFLEQGPGHATYTGR
jgi:enoyl-CoA hydratase/carnithine racemase